MFENAPRYIEPLSAEEPLPEVLQVADKLYRTLSEWGFNFKSIISGQEVVFTAKSQAFSLPAFESLTDHCAENGVNIIYNPDLQTIQIQPVIN